MWPFFPPLRDTHMGTHISLLWVIYSQESEEMNLLLPERGYTLQPKPSIQAGRHSAVTKSFLELLILCVTPIVAVPLLRNLTHREEVRRNVSLSLSLSLPLTERAVRL